MGDTTLLTPEARQIIVDNCTLTGEELRKKIKKDLGIDVSASCVLEQAKKARKEAEEATKTADAFISKKITEKVDKEVVPFMEIIEREIRRLADALEGKDPRLRVRPEVDRDGIETGYINSKEYTLLVKELRENIKAYVALRPNITTIKIDQIDTETERKFLDMCSPEDIAVIERLKREWEAKQRSQEESQ